MLICKQFKMVGSMHLFIAMGGKLKPTSAFNQAENLQTPRPFKGNNYDKSNVHEICYSVLNLTQG